MQNMHLVGQIITVKGKKKSRNFQDQTTFNATEENISSECIFMMIYKKMLIGEKKICLFSKN
jgi:hypothetical protein